MGPKVWLNMLTFNMLNSTSVLIHINNCKLRKQYRAPSAWTQKREEKKEDFGLWSKYFEYIVKVEDTWSGVVSLTAFPPQICAVCFLRVTKFALSKCGTSHLIFICLFIAPLWTWRVLFVKTSGVLYGLCFYILICGICLTFPHKQD